MKRFLLLLLALSMLFVLLAGCRNSKNKGIEAMEAYLDCLIEKDFDKAYTMLSAFDKENIDQQTYVEWMEVVSKIIDIKSFSIDKKVDKFNNYKYMGTSFKNALGLKIQRSHTKLRDDIEILTAYNKEEYRQMVSYEDKEWKVLILLSKERIQEITATYKTFLEK